MSRPAPRPGLRSGRRRRHAAPASDVGHRALAELAALDLAVHDTVAGTPTPTLDQALGRVSNAANYSRLWVVTAAVLSLLGRRGRRAAVVGLAAVGATSATANLVVKPLLRRGRPVRVEAERGHRVKMPTSGSFPSGHTASAFAFSSAAGAELPVLALPLRLAATAVGWSRVQSGVHFPGDVVAGALLGASIGSWTHRLAARRRAAREG
ncbi:MAG: phosphatase PAP2 family protein [Oryzihumus sp.]